VPGKWASFFNIVEDEEPMRRYSDYLSRFEMAWLDAVEKTARKHLGK
jgi:hypothetical protein